MCIVGSAGTRKSFLIDCIHHILSISGQHTALAATTGIAAMNISGVTLNSLFGLNIYLHNDIAYMDQQWVAVQKLNAIIVDEFSMLDYKLFDKINQLCQKTALPQH